MGGEVTQPGCISGDNGCDMEVLVKGKMKHTDNVVDSWHGEGMIPSQKAEAADPYNTVRQRTMSPEVLHLQFRYGSLM